MFILRHLSLLYLSLKGKLNFFMAYYFNFTSLKTTYPLHNPIFRF